MRRTRSRKRESERARISSFNKFSAARPRSSRQPVSMTDSFDLPLRTKIAAGLLTAILVLIVGAISFWATSRAAESAAEVEHTSEVLLEQQKLLAGLADAETAARGYTLTAQDSFLLPLEAAKVR